MAVIDFGGVKEEVVTRDEFPVAQALDVLKDETIAVIGGAEGAMDLSELMGEPLEAQVAVDLERDVVVLP